MKNLFIVLLLLNLLLGVQQKKDTQDNTSFGIFIEGYLENIEPYLSFHIYTFQEDQFKLIDKEGVFLDYFSTIKAKPINTNKTLINHNQMEGLSNACTLPNCTLPWNGNN